MCNYLREQIIAVPKWVVDSFYNYLIDT